MSGRPLADFVKAGQKSSESWKMKWIQYTADLNGVRDPMKHDDTILQGFIDQNRGEFSQEMWFQQALQGHFPPPRPQMGQAMQRAPQNHGQWGGHGGYGQPSHGPAMQHHPGMMHQPGAGGPMALVDAVKAGQRADQGFKEAWWNFCDTYCEGIRDPNRHPVQNLELFLSEHKPGMAGMGGQPRW